MMDFEIENGVLKNYKGSGGAVVIPDSVTSIGESAFQYCKSLTSVTIPDSVKSIGYRAFSSCSKLKSVTIPDSVTEIRISAFSGTPWFENYPDDFVIVGANILIKYKRNVQSVTIPDSVTSIGEYAFSGCKSLTLVTIPDSVTSIEESAFQYCKGLTSVTIPDSVKSIGEYAFSGCENLTSVTIPNSVTSIGYRAFSGCESLTSIKVSKNNPNYASEDGILFNKDKTELIQYPIGNTRTKYVTSDSVTSIGEYAFSRCSKLTSVTISDSVTSIGYGVFYGCKSLTSFTYHGLTFSLPKKGYVNIPDIFILVKNRDFSMKMEHVAKYYVIWLFFSHYPEDKPTINYIKKNCK